MNRDDQWEDIVRRLGGSAEQARVEPAFEESADKELPQSADEDQSFVGAGPRDYTLADEEVEDFQPPEPKPVSAGSPRTILSWFGVIGAAVLWILAGMGSWQLPWWLSIASTLGFLAGAMSLFFLLPKTWAHRERFDDDDYGNGAKI